LRGFEPWILSFFAPADPANNEVVTKVPNSKQQEMERAVEAAKAAFPVKLGPML
jgi:acyl-CoA reductase-like NAD-dependent aldehyde dehydrogenase